MTDTTSVASILAVRAEARQADTTNRISIVTMRTPPQVGKTFSVDTSGELHKQSPGPLRRGVVSGGDVTTARQMADTLTAITARPDVFLMTASWRGDDGRQFEFLTQKAVARLTRIAVGDPAFAAIHTVPRRNGGEPRRLASRHAASLVRSCWLHLDADMPPGWPYGVMTIAERLEEWDRIISGFSTCERIEWRSSSSRVHKQGEAPGERTHALIRVNRPDLLGKLRNYLKIASVNADCAFQYQRPGHPPGEWRSMFDWAPLNMGQPVFTSAPVLDASAEAAGYVVAGADVQIVNEGGGVLDISRVDNPDPIALASYAATTGHAVALDGEGMTVSNLLTLETVVESRHGPNGRERRTLADWLRWMETLPRRDPRRIHLRCEAPFRNSESDNAFIGTHPIRVRDNGAGTTYVLAEGVEEARDAAGMAMLRERLRELRPDWAGASDAAFVEQRQVEAVQLNELRQQNAAMAELDALTAYVPPGVEDLPRRDWQMRPAYQRGRPSALVSPGGVGKSLLIVGEALSLVSGKQILPPRTPTRPYRVCIINAEDEMDELHLRIAAAMKRHNITREEIGDRLFVMTPQGAFTLTRLNQNGAPEAVEATVVALIEFLKRKEIDVLILDPLASFNKANETNEGMQCVIEALRRVAREANVSVRIVHHMNKAGDGDVRSSRGGTAFTDGVRHADALATMTKDEADAQGVPPNERRRYVRLVDGKANYAAVDDDRWFRIMPDHLPNGESVAALVTHTMMPQAAPITVAQAIHAALTERGEARAAERSPEWFGHVVAGLVGLTGTPRYVRRQAARWLAELVRRGVVVEASRPGPMRNGEPTSVPLYRPGAAPDPATWRPVL